MRFPLRLNLSLTTHIARQRLQGNEKYPLVLMLEPLHLCNLACDGCGRIVEYKESIREMMSLEECLQAVDECGAPVVSICGGEPLIYPNIKELVEGVLERGKHIYLCTNALLLVRSLPRFRPSSSFTINVHLDGMAETHDKVVGQSGTVWTVIEAIKAAKERGFRVSTNTTIYKETNMQEVEALFTFLTYLKVDGMLISPGYSYEAVKERDIFLARREVRKKFADIMELSKRFPLLNSPIYLRFLKGDIELKCSAWANPTVNPQGWRGPCYMITDTHHKSFQDLIEKTEWERYGVGRDDRCANCLVHCGFEPTAVKEVGRSFKNLWETVRWNFF